MIQKEIFFLNAISDLKNEYIKKLKILALLDKKETISNLNQGLNKLLDIESKRTQQGFYALWYFLSKTSIDNIANNSKKVHENIVNLFKLMKEVDNKKKFIKEVKKFWKAYA